MTCWNTTVLVFWIFRILFALMSTFMPQIATFIYLFIFNWVTIQAPASRWISSSKCQHLVADKAYPPLFWQQEERVTHIQHVFTTGCYQTVSATFEQWLNLCSRDGWDKVIIVLLSFYRSCYIVIYIVLQSFGTCFVSEQVDCLTSSII